MTLLVILLPLTLNNSTCTIDSCGDNICSLETPYGFFDIQKQTDYEEGKSFGCLSVKITNDL